ncbi:response regulator transcription factor [Halomonas janggokensis]|uniref:Response regulator transcription factor n=1 Tax=Vreelandella janggokensis TaxID=370767 RepID=A0ABT4IQC4_9GAMM|nr:response regulator transcription factor [Halomonas janggokensis]MCZ0925870.1 response regulator transcription factor [Halomonas janggokensis]MCZ0930937.1 response regulator transcription factor [Halomonas janggokensis]
MNYKYNTIQVLLADEHQLVLSAISSLIESFDDMTVVAEVGSEQPLMKGNDVYNDVDVAIIDAALISLNGEASVSKFKTMCPKVRIVILSSYTSDSFIRRLFDEGIDGFLHKNSNVNTLKMAIQKAALGERFVFTSMEPMQFVEASSVVGKSAIHDNPLTSRQSEVLELVAKGFRSKAIADQLNVSIKTIETHRADIMRRLGVRHMAGLVHEAIKLGLLVSPNETDKSK